MPQATIQYLDEAGVRALAEQLATGMNSKIYSAIIISLDSATNRDNVHSLSALGLYNILGAANASGSTTINGKINGLSSDLSTLQQTVNNYTHLQIEVVTGAITTVSSPSTSKLYLQRDDPTDDTFVMYIYRQNVEVPVLDANDEPTYDQTTGELITQIVNQWVSIGKTDVILTNYWSKSEISDLKDALSMYDISLITTSNYVSNKVATAFNS